MLEIIFLKRILKPLLFLSFKGFMRLRGSGRCLVDKQRAYFIQEITAHDCCFQKFYKPFHVKRSHLLLLHSNKQNLKILP